MKHTNPKGNNIHTGDSLGLSRQEDPEIRKLHEHIELLYNRIEVIAKAKSALEKRVELLEKKIEGYQEKVSETLPEESNKEEFVDIGETIVLDVNPEEKRVEPQVQEKPLQQHEETSDWIYFGIPENGCFRVSSQKKNGESNICYRINTKSLEIEYIHSKLDSRWLAYRNEYLLPICDIVNNVASASSIKMEQPGKVVKQGEDYVIDSKNKIKIKLL